MLSGIGVDATNFAIRCGGLTSMLSPRGLPRETACRCLLQTSVVHRLEPTHFRHAGPTMVAPTCVPEKFVQGPGAGLRRMQRHNVSPTCPRSNMCCCPDFSRCSSHVVFISHSQFGKADTWHAKTMCSSCQFLAWDGIRCLSAQQMPSGVSVGIREVRTANSRKYLCAQYKPKRVRGSSCASAQTLSLCVMMAGLTRDRRKHLSRTHHAIRATVVRHDRCHDSDKASAMSRRARR